MSDTTEQLPVEAPAVENRPMEGASRSEHVFQQAQAIFGRSADWVAFFRQVLGVEGLIRRTFRNADELAAFEKSPYYAEIQQMLAQLRERSKHPDDNVEPMRVITVRLPQSLHEALKAEAHERKTSMNQLCISKLIQLIDQNLVPQD